MSGVLYRMRDADGDLLYVGCTMNPVTRFPEHKGKEWFTQVASIDLEHFDKREQAGEAERVAIKEENPKFNRQRNPGRPRTEDEINEMVAKRWQAEDVDIAHEQALKFEQTMYRVPGLHCFNCGWAGGWIQKGKRPGDCDCPRCGIKSLRRGEDLLGAIA